MFTSYQMMILLWPTDQPMFLQYGTNSQEKLNVYIVKESPSTPKSIAMKYRHNNDLAAMKKSFEDIDLKKKSQNTLKNMVKFEKLVSSPEFIFHYKNQRDNKLYYEYEKYNIDFILVKSDFKKYLSKEKFTNSELNIEKINALNIDHKY